MQHDEVIWQVINHDHCSFKAKTKTLNFCRNEYNVTGLCNRSSCPLANSRYATIREENGRIYLYMKSIERAHTPSHMWQKIRLKKQYAEALKQLDEHLEFWPKFLVHKNKQRLTKITQYLIRMRKLALKIRPKLVPLARRTEKRERQREAKAEVAAQLEKSIEKELLERLQKGVYPTDIVNINMKEYEKVLDAETQADDEAEEYFEADEDEEEEEEDLNEEQEVEYEDDEEEQVEYLEDSEVDFSSDDDDEEDDMEDLAGPDGRMRPAGHLGKRPSGSAEAASRKAKRRQHANIEYEEEREYENPQQSQLH
ncbi:hypothetical protein ABBQ38_001931 [Trebouxia sp. C0009 RCD-2024]